MKLKKKMKLTLFSLLFSVGFVSTNLVPADAANAVWSKTLSCGGGYQAVVKTETKGKRAGHYIGDRRTGNWLDDPTLFVFHSTTSDVHGSTRVHAWTSGVFRSHSANCRCADSICPV